jgi:GntR family transcriptional regulator
VLIRVDTTSGLPLFEQIAAQIRGAVGRGEVDIGDRLPSARELAAVIGVNLHTVLRAYQQLADESLVEMRRGRGVTITSSAPQADLSSIARALVAQARHVGLADIDIIRLVKGLL